MTIETRLPDDPGHHHRDGGAGMSRRIAVEANDERNAHLSGRPVKVSIQTTPFQGSVVTLTRAEAEALLKALSDHLSTTTREDPS